MQSVTDNFGTERRNLLGNCRVWKDTSCFFGFAALADKILQPQDHRLDPFKGNKQDRDPVQSLFIYNTVHRPNSTRDDWKPSTLWLRYCRDRPLSTRTGQWSLVWPMPAPSLSICWFYKMDVKPSRRKERVGGGVRLCISKTTCPTLP